MADVLGNNRDERLKRRMEADEFRRVFQPISTLFGVVGLLIFVWAIIGKVEGQGSGSGKELFGAGITLMSFPILVLLFRLSRGHFRKDLHR